MNGTRKSIGLLRRTAGDLRKQLSTITSGIGTASMGQSLSPAAPYSGAVRDTVTIVDVSGSMGLSDFQPSRLDGAIQASTAHATTCAKDRPGDRIAIVSFSDTSKVVLPLTPATRRRTILAAFCRLTIDGGTDLAKGLEAAARLFEKQGQPDRRRHVILLTDGHGGNPLKAAAKLKEKLGAVIDVVGIGGSPKAVNETLLRKIATTEPSGLCHYRFIKDPQALSEHYTQLAKGLVWRGSKE